MNVERLRELAGVLKEQPLVDFPYSTGDDTITGMSLEQAINLRPKGFNIGVWNCHTAACVCGWAVHLFGEQAQPGSMVARNVGHFRNWGAELLGLTDDEADGLFGPNVEAYPEVDSLRFTPEAAAKVLERLADIGEQGGEGLLDSEEINEIWANAMLEVEEEGGA